MNDKAITWDELKEFIYSMPTNEFSNSDLSGHFKADQADVAQLARLMAKAGVLSCRQTKLGNWNLYSRPDK